MNLIIFDSRPHSKNHQYVFLATRQDLCEWTLLHQCIPVEQGMFLFRHIKLNSMFIVMTINEITLNWPKVFPDFSVVSWFCRLKTFGFALKLATEIFTLYRMFQSQSGSSEFMVSSQQLCCTSAMGKIKQSPSVALIFLLRWSFDDKFPMRLSSPILHCLPRKYLLSKFPPFTSHIRWIFQVELSFQMGEVWTCLVQKSDNIQPLHQTE